MQTRTWFLLVIVVNMRSSDGGCPRATFKFVNDRTSSSYNFIDSPIGNIGSLESCPPTGRPYVYLSCYPNSSWGNEPYFVPCLTPVPKSEPMTTTSRSSSPPDPNPYFSMSIGDVAKMPITTSNDVSNMLSYLNQETMRFNSSSNIVSAVSMIDRLAMNNQTNASDAAPMHMYSIANKLLAPESLSHMQEAQHSNRSIVRLLSSLEAFSQTLHSNELDNNFILNHFAVSIVNMPDGRRQPIVGFAFDSSNNRTSPIGSTHTSNHSTVIKLDSQVAAKQNRLAFSVYDHRTGLFDQKQYRILTPVLSLTVDKPPLTRNLRPFVSIEFQLDKRVRQNNATVTCAYWRIFENMTAQWSTTGCNLTALTDEHVVCECNHLTHFAVLMAAEQSPLPEVVKQVLSIITLSGLFLSSVGLCLTILTFACFKKLRRHFSQKSLLLLSINLLLVNILFAILGLQTLTHLPCTIIASLLHYFILASFSWMFIMASIQYLLFVKVFPRSISAFTRKAAVFAQVLPLVPVIVVLVIDPANYTKRTDGICWLTALPFYLSFLLPIALYILINSALFAVVAHSLLCGKTGQQLRSTQAAESQRLSRFSVALSCFVVLGLTWSFGLFAIGPMRVLFQILFCTFASLTGFFIFLLYIVTSRAKRACWNNTFKSLGIPSIYSPTLSTSSVILGTKEFSTSSSNDQSRLPSRHAPYPHSQPQHFIDAYMPSSPPPPAPPPFLLEDDDPLDATTLVTNSFYEPRHVWAPQTNYIYESNPMGGPPMDDYSLFYASHHDATKL